MEANFATVWEAIADSIGDEPAIIQGSHRLTWAQYEDRASRLAAAYAEAGVAKDGKVALFMYNSAAYQEAYFAAFKQRAIPINVNYRYLDDELRYLLDNSDSEVVVYHSSLGERIAAVRDDLPDVRRWIEVDDGGTPLVGVDRIEDVISGTEPAPRLNRSASDGSMVYTGGTTGMPKGVMGTVGPGVEVGLQTVPPMIGEPPIAVDEVGAEAARLAAEGKQVASLTACPLMHGTGMGIGSNPIMVCGGRLILLENRHLDPAEIWDTAERERATSITVVGDPFARPMLRQLDADADGTRSRDLSSLKVISSAGAMFSREIKDGLCDHLPHLLVLDIIASTEAAMGQSFHSKGRPAPTGIFTVNQQTQVLRDDGRPVEADGEEVGTIAVRSSGRAGYYKDEKKTASTFREIDGVVWTYTGDHATVAPDGAVTLLGRGSQVINSAGEKVFAEEVEETVKTHDAVFDCLVVGLPDEKFGSRVVAVVSASDPAVPVDEESIIAHTKARLAHYKAPRQVVVTETVPRAPNGKADYKTARVIAGAG